MKKKYLTYESIIPWGRYKGRSIQDVEMEDPGYIAWIVEHWDNVIFDPAIVEDYKDF